METGLGAQNGPIAKSFIDPETGKKMVQKGDILFPPRKVWIKTFGCQMNYHDSERILFHLKDLNFTPADGREDADLILFNTCAIRDLSNMKFYSQLGETKHNKKNKKDLVVGVGGCVAQTEGKELIKKYKHLDFAFGTDVIDSIGDMVYRTYAGESKFKVNAWDRSDNFSIQTKITHGSPQAFVNIIKGCNKYCSYCIVPYTRGKEKSRRLNEVVEDVKRLVKYQGIQEVTLLGQNVNSYGKENGESLAKLIIELDKVEGLELIRYTTSHPYDVSDELIAVHGSSKKLSNHLHLPVQSGSNSVLQRMLREYTSEHFLGLCAKLRKSNPNIVLSTDIIVGFPNETAKEYQATLDLLDKAQFDFIYSYTFSPRPGTKAAIMDDLLTDKVRKERLINLQKYQLEIQKKIRSNLVDRTMLVLVDGQSNMKGIKKWKGRTNCNRIIHFLPGLPDKNHQWNWVDLKITSTTPLSCNGELVQDHGRTPPKR
ncbi:MAG: tRNA (N6-isopentenyl adenosine(37)-C2)-methylthiotransferase MiaB [Epsilonproteobacteria bacterium]|nr:MAG: tRNA (N6-isopentenyl adenosine(37)-C2)-methylthiotransferase MiaB [Campylobacterota bacterium]